MLQISNLSEYNEQDIPQLYALVLPILEKRKRLHDRYSRLACDSRLMFSGGNTKLPFEKFLVDLASGYTSGKPTYNVNVSPDEETNKLISKLFGKDERDEEYIKSMGLIIKYITSYNDDAQENYDLIHDIFEMTSCYEVIYENDENEIVYSRYSPLQTVATWDYSIPANLTGLIRVWNEKLFDGGITTKIELTDKNGTRIYSLKDNYALEESRNNHNWGDVPAIAVETDYSLFEPCEDVIQAYEQIIQNVRNTAQYNDTDCKLKITGYSAENDLMTTDENGNEIPNPLRAKEDSMWYSAKTLFIGEGGDVEWLEKTIDATGIEKIIKIYQELMFQLAGIPNTNDLSFNSNNLNTSAIDRKFYIMNMATASIVSELKKAYLRRWELIFNRINLKKGTHYDFRDIIVDIPKNLPANDDELITSMLKLKGTISNETIVGKLGYDYNVEKQNIDNETEDKIIANIESMQMMRNGGLGGDDIQDNSLFNHYDTSQKGVNNEMDTNGQKPQVDLQGN